MRNGLRRRAWVLALLLTGVALFAAACGGGGPSLEDPRLLEFDDELTTPGQGHLQSGVGFPYPTDPPYGGPHGVNLLPCGIYQDQQPPGSYLHTMEHGAVVIHYQPDVFANEDVAAVRRLGSQLLESGERVIVQPNRTLSSPIVVASWGRLLPLAELEESAIRAFVDAFEDDGPESISRSRAC